MSEHESPPKNKKTINLALIVLALIVLTVWLFLTPPGLDGKLHAPAILYATRWTNIPIRSAAGFCHYARDAPGHFSAYSFHCSTFTHARRIAGSPPNRRQPC